MLIPIVIIVTLVQIIAKSHNYNIKIPKNPDFDIRVRRNTVITDTEAFRDTIIDDILREIDEDQTLRILDELENIINKQITISESKTIKQHTDNQKDTLLNDNIKIHHDTNVNQNVSTDFDTTKTESIVEEVDTSDFISKLVNIIVNTDESEEIIKDKNANNQSEDTSIDSDATLENYNVKIDKIRKYIDDILKPDEYILTDKLKQETIETNRDTSDENEPVITRFDETTTKSIDNELENTDFILKLNDIIKDLKSIVTLNNTDRTAENKDKRSKSNISILEIITKDRYKRRASPDSVITNFFSTMYNKVYNITHPGNPSTENNNIQNNSSVNSNYNQYNDIYNQHNINNNNAYINNQDIYNQQNNNNNFINNQANQYYNNYNTNRYNYNDLRYPLYTPTNNTYNNIYNTPYSNAYRTYPYNYGYNYNPYYNNHYNTNNSSINNNHTINNFTDYKDSVDVNTTTESTIIQGCILCSYVGCPVNYKRVGYMCVKMRG